MTNLNISQQNNSGQNIISINNTELRLTELIKTYKKSKSNQYNIIDISVYNDHFNKHISKNIKSKKLQNSDFNDTHINDFYVPLIITRDISALRSSRSNISTGLEKKLKSTTSSNENISEAEYLKYKAQEHLRSNHTNHKNRTTVFSEETNIDENFVIENYFNEKIDNIINIQAGAGHGKTTILKKILFNQSVKGTKKAIFIDLKSIESNLISQILKIFSEIIPEIDTPEIFKILDSEKIILIMDAFDEINSNIVNTQKVIEDIILISNTFNIPILISSRPNSSLLKTSGIKILGIKDLNDDQLLRIFIKLKKQDNFNIQLIQDFLKNPAREAIKTPLLANLFIKTFPQLTSFPENSRDFYNKIFDLLYSGHDSFKEGARIHRSLHEILSMEKSKEYFSLLSMLALCFNIDNVSSNKYSSKLGVCLDHLNIGEERKRKNFAKEFIESIIECTSLLVDTGGAGDETTYTFLHRSIQEYYSAYFFRTNIYDEDTQSFDDEFLSPVLKSIENEEAKYIDFIKNLYYSNKKLFSSKILSPIIQSMNNKKNSDEINDYFLRRIARDIKILLVSETTLSEKIASKKTFRTAIFVEIQNTTAELDSTLSSILMILNSEQKRKLNSILDSIYNEISQIVTEVNAETIDYKKIKINKPDFFVKTYNFTDFQKLLINNNPSITEKIASIVDLINSSYEETLIKSNPTKKGLADLMEA